MEIYNEDYYKHGCGPIPYIGPKHWIDFFGMVADKLIANYHPTTVLDAGCAVGYLVAALRDRGVDAYGIDISEYAISQVRDDIKSYCVVGSLTDPLPETLPKHYDLVTNIEVLEHLYAEEAPIAVANLCSLSDTIIFSSSPDDYSEPTHVNVQQREYWAKLFAQNGFYDCLSNRPTFLTAHAICFQRSENWLRQIEDYERNIRLEAQQTNDRNALIESQNQHIEKLNNHIQSQQDEYTKKIESLNAESSQNSNDMQKYKTALEKSSLELKTLQEKKEELEEQAKTLKEKKEELEEQAKTLQEKNEELEEQTKALQDENKALGIQYKFTLDKYYEVSNSTTWKLTKPFRVFLDSIKGVLKSNSKTLVLYKALVCLIKSGPKRFLSKVKKHLKRKKTIVSNPNNTLSGPKISILVPLYHTPEEYLREMLESVIKQTYSNWELCLCDASEDDLSVQSICAEYTLNEPRIVYLHLDSNMGISENTNACEKLATGEYIALLDHDDFLMPDALAENIRVINELHPDVIYSDEDHYSADHRHINPFFKPDWSPDLLYSQMYIGHLLLFRRRLFEMVGGFRKEYDGSQDYDLMLRMSEQTDNIYHIPLILYSWRESENSTAANANAKPYAHDAGRQALDEHLKRKYGAQAYAADGPYTFVYDARFPILADVLVSIIIPMKDKWELTDSCVNSILKKSTYSNFEIIILDNRSAEDETRSWLQSVEKEDTRIRVIQADMEFNWSKINNFGVRNAKGDVYVFLNNDTLVITPDWLERLCENALRQEIGTVGALLKYEDESIQHAGVVVGMNGWADHVFKGMDTIHFGAPFVSPMVNRDVTAVTGACVAIAKNKFETLGGFDESFIICGSDVELGIRANNAGLYNLYDASVQLYHLESKSRSSYIPEVDFERSSECYAPYREECDPFFNPNLDINSTMPKENCTKNSYKNKPVQPQNKFIRKSLPSYDSVDINLLPNPYRISEIEPLNPRAEIMRSKVRLNLLTPSVDKKHVFGGISTAIKFFEAMCDSMNCEQRIILTDAAYQASTSVLDTKYTLVHCNENSPAPSQIVPFYDRACKTIPVSQNDIFIATAWWTAYTAADIIRWQKKTYGGNFNPLVYLIQDYEPGFYPWSSRYMLADSTYRMEIPVLAVFNSELLKQHFDANHYSFAKSWYFDPVLNDRLAEFLPDKKTVSKKRQLLIYARPNTDRNAFSLIVMALRKWAEIYSEADQWKIVAAGEEFESVAISNTIRLESVGKLTLDAYANVLLDSYVGISLMVSPHPSYPPLEMSTFGIKTITNCYGNKNLESFNPNIISLDSCSPLVVANKLLEICESYTGEGQLANSTDYAFGNNNFTFTAHEVMKSIEETVDVENNGSMAK